MSLVFLHLLDDLILANVVRITKSALIKLYFTKIREYPLKLVLKLVQN